MNANASPSLTELRYCESCKFWSELVAESRRSVIRAMCLNADSPNANRMTVATESCDKHEPGEPVDLPERRR